MARTRSAPENPLRHLARPETPYVLEWEVLDAPSRPAPRRDDADALAALRRAEDSEL